MKLFIPNVYETLFEEWLEETSKNIVILSGRNSGKTEVLARYLFYNVFKFKSSAIIVTKNEKYIPRNILRTMKRVAIEIGVYDELEFPKSKPFTIRSKKDNFTIDFFGIGDDVYNIKGYEPAENLSVCWFEEFGEMSYDDIQIIKQTLTRNMSSNRKFLFSGNPPKSPKAWNRLWVDQVRDDKDYLVFNVNAFDIYPFLSESNRKDIEELYRNNRKDFEYTYLGLPVTEGEKVYSNIRDEHIVSTEQKLDGIPHAWTLGGDVAVVRDKTGVVLNILLTSGRIITRKAWSHDPIVHGRLTISEQAEYISKIYKNIIENGVKIGNETHKIGHIQHRVILDSSNYSLDSELRNRGVQCMNVSNKRQIHDIEVMRTLINNNRMYFCNKQSNGYPCNGLMSELYSLSWYIPDLTDDEQVDTISQRKKGDSFKLIGKKDLENAWRYGCSWLIRFLGRKFSRLDDLPSSVKPKLIKNYGGIDV